MSLDLGALIGRVVLDTAGFDASYAIVVRRMGTLGVTAEDTTRSTVDLDGALGESGVSAQIAAKAILALSEATAGGEASTTRLRVAQLQLSAVQEKAAETARSWSASNGDLAASQAAVLRATAAVTSAQTDADAVTSRLTASQLRLVAAQGRLDELQESGTASARQLASAQASLIGATNAVAAAQARAADAAAADTAALDAQAGSYGRALGGGRGFRAGIAEIPGPVKAAATAIVVLAAASIDLATKFQDATKRIQTQANATAGEVAHLSAGMLQLAASVGTTPVVLADAAYHIESVGLRGAAALNVLKIAAEGAKIGGANLTDVTNGLDAAIVSGIGGVQNYSQAMGALNATVGAGDMTMQDLADALGTGVLAVIKGYGVTLNQASAALAVFGDNNIRGAEAGTSLRMSVQALTKPVQTGADALAKLGLTGSDAFSHFATDLQQGGLTKALTDLQGRLVATGNTGAKEGEILTDAFGRKAGVGLSVLIGQFTRYQQKLGDVTTGANTFASDWKAYTQTFSFAADSVKAGAEAAATGLGQELLPAATGALRWIGTDGVKDLETAGHELGTMLGYVGPLAPAFHDLADAGAHLLDAVSPLGRLIATLGLAGLAGTASTVGVVFRATATVVDVLATGLDHLKPEIVAVGVAFAAMRLAPLAGELTAVQGAVSRLSVSSLTAGVKGLAGSFADMLNPVTLTAGAVGFAGYEFLKSEAANRAADAAARAYIATMSTLNSLKVDSVGQLTVQFDDQQSKLVAVSDAFGRYETDMLNSRGGTAEMSQALAGLSAATGLSGQAAVLAGSQAAGALRSLDATSATTSARIAELGAQYHMTSSEVLAFASANGLDLVHGMGAAQAGFATLTAAAASNATHAAELTTATDGVSSSMSDAATQAADLASALDLINGNAAAAALGENTLMLSISQLAGDLDKSSRSLDTNTDAGRTNADALITRLQALDTQAAALQKSDAATMGNTAATAAATSQYAANYAALLKSAGAAHLSTAQVNALAQSLGFLPKQVDTALHVNPTQADAATAATKAKLASIPTSITSTMYADLTPAQRSLAKLGLELAAEGRAAGVDFAGGLKQGMLSQLTAVANAAANMGQTAKIALSASIERNSPSKVAMRIGADFGEGFRLGIVGTHPAIRAAAAGAGTAATMGVGVAPKATVHRPAQFITPTASASDPAAGAPASGGRGGVTFTGPVNLSNGVDIDLLAARLGFGLTARGL